MPDETTALADRTDETAAVQPETETGLAETGLAEDVLAEEVLVEEVLVEEVSIDGMCGVY